MDLDYKEIGKRIARRRKELGLKQSEVEERADLSQKYLSNIEWKNSSELLRNMSPKQRSLAKKFLVWLSEQDL